MHKTLSKWNEEAFEVIEVSLCMTNSGYVNVKRK